MADIIYSPLFGIALSIFAFLIGHWINRKVQRAWANPLLIAIFIVIGVLSLLKIPLEAYTAGGDIIQMFLAPATAVLALTIYRQRKVLRKDFLPVFLGTAVGSLTAVGSVLAISKFLALEEVLVMSLLPKSVTTAVAIALSESLGGIAALTVSSTLITGLGGNLLAPYLIRLFRVSNPVAQGVAIGTSSHALGTSKAIEIGEIQGAMSSVSISLSAIWTVLLASILF